MLRPLRTFRRRFVADRSGAMAVEFALVAAPLLFMLFAIIELALVFMVCSTLENATTEVARTIRTGALQTGGGATANTFRNQVCGQLGWLQAQCQTSLSVDVRTYEQFRDQNAQEPVANGVFNEGALLFDMGTAEDVVLVRTFYRWKLITPFLKFGVPVNGGKSLLTAVATFRNEPYLNSP